MNTAIQKANTDAKRDIRTLIQSQGVRDQMAMVLPKHLTADRMARVAVTTVMRVPKLMQCTQESLLSCLMQCSQLGLEPDGRRAHLIPFENKKKGTVECTLIIDWKGLAELALRSGMIASLHADVICEKDEFAYDLGEILHHKINFREDRGEPYAAYALAKTKTGEKFVQVMTRKEIEGIRDNSQGWRAFKNGYTTNSPWNDAPGEMWKKTAFRRLAKWLPLSPEIRDAIEVEDEGFLPSKQVFLVAEIPESTEISEKPTFTKKADQSSAASESETPETAAQVVERVIADEGKVTFDNFADWLKTTSGIDLDAKGISSYAELTEEIAAPLAADPKQMKNCVTIHGGKS